MAAKLLGALCCYICDPSVNMVNQEIKPADSLGQLLLFYLNSKSALQRISVALVICEWAALQKTQQQVLTVRFLDPHRASLDLLCEAQADHPDPTEPLMAHH